MSHISTENDAEKRDDDVTLPSIYDYISGHIVPPKRRPSASLAAAAARLASDADEVRLIAVECCR